MIVYFSGTGNSRFAAKFLAQELGEELLDAGERIKAGEAEALHSERPWIFVAPTYAWRMPRVFQEYLQKTELNGSKDVYFLLTCGGDIGAAGKYAAELCDEKGLNYRGMLKVVMPENYIAMFDAPNKEESKEIVHKAKDTLRKGVALIRENKDFPGKKRGIAATFKSGPVNEGFYRFYVKADAFFVTENCTGCGACEGACPLNNIRLIGGAPVWGKNCTHCMACICGCPTAAIEYGKNSKGRERYWCPGE